METEPLTLEQAREILLNEGGPDGWEKMVNVWFDDHVADGQQAYFDIYLDRLPVWQGYYKYENRFNCQKSMKSILIEAILDAELDL